METRQLQDTEVVSEPRWKLEYCVKSNLVKTTQTYQHGIAGTAILLYYEAATENT